MNMAGHQSGGSYMNMQSEPKCSRRPFGLANHVGHST
uniref:MIP06303p n=1 Tax=Drosophila melanogaster TaxID=7227 RepID=C0P8N9_DROME|nr:MIP06303p [Drosophila melanogaster]